MTTIRIEVETRYVDELIALLKKATLGKSGRITVEADDTLTHEQLMALPEAERMKYYDAHGGVLNVMKENGYTLSEDAADDILEFIRQQR